jgi:hypothetical protein
LVVTDKAKVLDNGPFGPKHVVMFYDIN